MKRRRHPNLFACLALALPRGRTRRLFAVRLGWRAPTSRRDAIGQLMLSFLASDTAPANQPGKRLRGKVWCPGCEMEKPREKGGMCDECEAIYRRARACAEPCGKDRDARPREMRSQRIEEYARRFAEGERAEVEIFAEVG